MGKDSNKSLLRVRRATNAAYSAGLPRILHVPEFEVHSYGTGQKR